MDFLKKHYEKILLSVVLVGLVVALVFMALIIPSEQAKVKQIGEGIIHRSGGTLTNLDLTKESNVVTRLQSPYNLDFQTTHRLFNPLEWQRLPDGTMIPNTHLGPQVAVVTGITPLYFVLNLDSVETNELGVRYVVAVERQAAANAAMRHRQSRYVSTDDPKKDVFTLVRVAGPPESPTGLVLRLADGGQVITLTNGVVFRRVDAYAADVKYEPEKQSWTQKRVGDHLHFAQDDYTIVDISSNEVVLSALSNQKKWTLRYTP